MQKIFDVIVIGAGVTGAAIARELSRYQLDVAVLEKEVDVSFGTSKANSGIIHGGFHASPDTLKGQLCAKANREFDRLHEELEFPFERCGELMIDRDFVIEHNRCRVTNFCRRFITIHVRHLYVHEHHIISIGF